RPVHDLALVERDNCAFAQVAEMKRIDHQFADDAVGAARNVLDPGVFRALLPVAARERDLEREVVLVRFGRLEMFPEPGQARTRFSGSGAKVWLIPRLVVARARTGGDEQGEKGEQPPHVPDALSLIS